MRWFPPVPRPGPFVRLRVRAPGRLAPRRQPTPTALLQYLRNAKAAAGYGGSGWSMEIILRDGIDVQTGREITTPDLRRLRSGHDLADFRSMKDAAGRLAGDELLDTAIYTTGGRYGRELYTNLTIDLAAGMVREGLGPWRPFFWGRQAR